MRNVQVVVIGCFFSMQLKWLKIIAVNCRDTFFTISLTILKVVTIMYISSSNLPKKLDENHFNEK